MLCGRKIRIRHYKNGEDNGGSKESLDVISSADA